MESAGLMRCTANSIPTAPTITPVESVGLTRQDSRNSWRKRGVLPPSCAQVCKFRSELLGKQFFDAVDEAIRDA
jgi:hypothetical protein